MHFPARANIVSSCTCTRCRGNSSPETPAAALTISISSPTTFTWTSPRLYWPHIRYRRPRAVPQPLSAPSDSTLAMPAAQTSNASASTRSPVVIDLGSSTIRIWANGTLTEVPNCIARGKGRSPLVGSAITRARDVSGLATIRTPMYRGHVTDWAACKLLLDHALAEALVKAPPKANDSMNQPSEGISRSSSAKKERVDGARGRRISLEATSPSTGGTEPASSATSRVPPTLTASASSKGGISPSDGGAGLPLEGRAVILVQPYFSFPEEQQGLSALFFDAYGASSLWVTSGE